MEFIPFRCCICRLSRGCYIEDEEECRKAFKNRSGTQDSSREEDDKVETIGRKDLKRQC